MFSVIIPKSDYPLFLEWWVLEIVPPIDFLVLLRYFSALVGNDSETWMGVVGGMAPKI